MIDVGEPVLEVLGISMKDIEFDCSTSTSRRVFSSSSGRIEYKKVAGFKKISRVRTG